MGSEGGCWGIVGWLTRVGNSLQETLSDVLMKLCALREEVGVGDGFGHVTQDAKVGSEVDKSVKP